MSINKLSIMKTGIIILAAGNSSRLGKPKQLLSYKSKTLLKIVEEAAIQSGCTPVIVVLGAYATEILKQENHPEITYITNDSWQEGMASSISAGLTALVAQYKHMEQVILAVSDQPFISSEVFLGLVEKHEQSKKPIVASSYAQTTGTPVLFNKTYFDQLLSLSGNNGAKHILEAHPEDVAIISFEPGKIDIDTETDYNNLINQP